MKTPHNRIARGTFAEMPAMADSKSQRPEKDIHSSGQGAASVLARMKLIDQKNTQLWSAQRAPSGAKALWMPDRQLSATTKGTAWAHRAPCTDVRGSRYSPQAGRMTEHPPLEKHEGPSS